MKDTKLLNIIKTIFLYSGRFILPYLPLKILHLMGNVVGSFMVGPKAQIIKDDLRVLLGNLLEPDLDIILRQTMQNFRKDLLEIWTFPRLNRDKINKMAYFEGIENLNDAREKGKGTILCITHFGSWKIVLPAIGYNGYKINQIATTPLAFKKETEIFSHNKITEIELDCETSLPVNFIYINTGKSARQIYRILENNEIVVISLDGIVGGRRMAMPFLNGSLLLSTGGVSLSLNTGAPLLPVFIVRQKDNKHKIVIHKPFFNNENEKQKYIQEWMISYTKLFEQYVRSYPDHYARYLYTIRKYPLPDIGYILKINNRNTEKEKCYL